jgi:hypothetical protein
MNITPILIIAIPSLFLVWIILKTKLLESVMPIVVIAIPLSFVVWIILKVFTLIP